MAKKCGPHHWVILVSPKEAGHDVRAVSSRWPHDKMTTSPCLMRRFPDREAAASWLRLNVEPPTRHRYTVVEDRREARAAAGAREDLKFCGRFAPTEEEAMWAFVETEVSP